ncbi:MAG TPA: alternative ribosome rescue aminoacyl-tRNA hydrolase ArfB, partial [Chryseosolibacter sp.]
MHRKISADLLGTELQFTTSRSSGPGGQNVNKVNSKVTLHFDVKNSRVLSPGEKDIIVEKLSPRLTREGVLTLSAQDKRSQLDNKEAVILRLDELLAKAFRKKKARKATKPSK